VQAHPEFDATFIDGLIKARAGTVPPALIETAKDNLTKDVDNTHLATQIGAFFKGVKS
jgi:GMP synthase (glutamine-hydrolysing)